MKNILIIETSCDFNGGQKMSLLISNYLRETKRYSIIWAIPGEGALSNKLTEAHYTFDYIGNTKLPPGIKHFSSIFRYFFMSIKCISSINKIIKRRGIDIIYAPGPASLPWSAVCGTNRKKPVIWHMHHIFSDKPTVKLINCFSKRKCVKNIISVSSAVGEQIKNKKGKQKICVEYNPVDFSKYNSGSFIKVQHERWASFGAEIVLCQIALLEKDKKQDVLVKALHELKRNGRNAIGIFIGKEDDERYIYTRYLKDLCKELSVEDIVYFLGYRNDVPDILKSPNLIVAINSFEGFPLAGLEAASAGVPIVACDKGGACEFVNVSQSGLTYKFDNHIDLVSKVLDCRNNREYFSQNGLRFAKESDYEKYFSKIEEVFKNCDNAK